MQIIGEAALRITALTRELGRSLQRSIDDSLRGVRAPRNNALTDLQRNLRDGELDLARARDTAHAAQLRVAASEDRLNRLRRSGTATAAQLTAAENDHRRALLARAVAVDRVSSAQTNLVRISDRSRAATIDLRRDNDSLRGAFGRLIGSLSSIGGALGRTALAGGKLALIGTAVLGAVGAVGALGGAVGGLVAALGQASGVAGLLPAAFAGYLAVAATVKLATKGMGDAFKAVAEGDAAAIDEALKRLAPSAQAFVREVSKARPAFERMQLTVQQRLFAGLADEVGALSGRYLPQATALFQGMAATLNGMIGDVARFGMSGRALAGTQVIVANLQTAFGNLRQAIAPLAAAIMDVVAVGATFLPRLTQQLADAVTKWSERISQMAASGELAAFFQRALDTMAQFGRVMGNIGSTIAGVFRAADGASGGFLNTLERLTARMSEFVNSAQGQEVIAGVFTRIKDTVSALMPVVLAVLDVMNQLAPVFVDIAETAGPILADAIQTLAPHIVTLAQFFADLLEAAGPLIEALVSLASDALAAIEPILPDIVDAFGRLADMFAELLNGGLGDALVDMFAALVEILPPLIDLFSALLEILGPILELLAHIVGFIATVLGGAISLVAELVDRLAGSDMTMREWALSAVGLGEAAGAGIRAAGVELFNFWDAASEMVAEHLIMIKGGVTGIGGAVAKSVADFNYFGDASTGALTRVGGSALQQQRAMADWSRKVRAQVLAVADIFDRLAGRTAGAMGRAGGAVQAFASTVRGVLGSIGSGAFASGAAIGDGLAAGIRSRVGAVAGAALALAAAAGSALPRSPAKVGPFSGRGWTTYRGQAIAEGLAAGIRSRLAEVESAGLRAMSVLAVAMTGAAVQLSRDVSVLAAPGSFDVRADNGITDAIRPPRRDTGDDPPTWTPDTLRAAVREGMAEGMTDVRVVVSAREVTSGVNRVNRANERR